jgi:hypothetical protein
MIIPSTNGSSTKHSYDSRLDYKKMALDFVEATRRKNRYIDLWYDKPLYGKIDLEGNAVYNLPESTLKQLSSDGDVLFAIDFVAHAFEDMKKYFTDAVAKKQMGNSIGPIEGLNPKRAWVSPLSAYEEHMVKMKDFFISNYLMANKKHILNIHDALKQYKKFISTHARDFPMTFSNFLLSDMCPLQSTGLIIELEEFKHGDDVVNLAVLDSSAFNKYASIVNRYGFFINKNAPYALVANLGSSSMKSYMKHYEIRTTGQYFNEYCYPAYRADIQKMKDFVYESYKEFVLARPFERATGVTKKGLKTRTKVREFLTLEELNSTISMNEWFRLCIFVKIAELQLEIHPTEVNRLVEKMFYLRSRYMSLNRAYKEMNEYFKKRNPRVNLLLEGKIPTPTDLSY